MNKVIFYFDFLSPFSFFAWKNLKNFEPEIELSYRPVAMGKLFKHHGFPGPGEIPAKRKYELKKCFRYCGEKGWPFRPPEIFPFNPIAALRAATFYASEEFQDQVIDKLFGLIWEQGVSLDDPELVKINLEPISPQIYERSFTPQARSELKANTKLAIEHGAFGVPSFIHQNELFWGNDSLANLHNKLVGNDNWNRELYDRFKDK